MRGSSRTERRAFPTPAFTALQVHIFVPTGQTNFTMNSFLGIIVFSALLFINSSEAQCDGSPTYIFPTNSSGTLAFPESNLDPMSGGWTSSYPYPLGVTCSWIIKAPPLHVIYLRILLVKTEKDFDFVTLYPSESRLKPLTKISGSEENIDVVTPDNMLVVDFESDEHTAGEGFHFVFHYFPKACVAEDVVVSESQYIALPPWNLQGVLPGPRRPEYEKGLWSEWADEHLLQTPGNPQWIPLSAYPQGLNCTWRIHVPPKHLLHIQVLNFQTDADDLLQVWSLEGGNPKRVLKYWGEEIPRREIKSSFPAVLSFVSGKLDQTQGSGFLLNVSYISKGCSPDSVELTFPRGLIGYPNHNLRGDEWQYNEAIYYEQDTCQWFLRAPEGYTFGIYILHLDTRPQDTIQIVDGTDELFNEGGRLFEEKRVTTSTNNVIIRFSSKSKSDRTGFLIKYNWLLKDCAFLLEELQGQIQSPFYPAAYELPLECSWTIKPPPGAFVHVRIDQLKLDVGDSLQVSDGNEERHYLFTDSSMEELIKTEALEFPPKDDVGGVTIRFSSDHDHNEGIFSLRYVMFQSGSCNFSLTPCGWTSEDILSVWRFREEDAMMAVEEETKIGFQLARGYKGEFISPLVVPSRPNSEMCFQLKYFLAGQDAYKMTVSLREDAPSPVNGESTSSVEWAHSSTSTSLVKVHGAQGKFFLDATSTFTARGPFQILVTYERGYGPHYKASIKEVSLTDGKCEDRGAGSQLKAFTCEYRASFCGWRNTHMDHLNWELTDRGITTFMDAAMGNPLLQRQRRNQDGQRADLISPKINLGDLKEEEEETNAPGACMKISYEIHSHLAELKVLVVESQSSSGLPYPESDETTLWVQGRVPSPRALNAFIPLAVNAFPSEFRIILRASSLRPNPSPEQSVFGASGLGTSVYRVALTKGTCPNVYNCDFQDGFCSWKVVSTGNTVWHIRGDGEGAMRESFAALSSKGTIKDSSEIVSPPLEGDKTKERILSFRENIPESQGRHFGNDDDCVCRENWLLKWRYLMQDTDQCIRVRTVTTKEGGGNASSASPPLKAIWEQCKSKGKHWLAESICLPPSHLQFTVVIESQTGWEGSKVFLDDIEILELENGGKDDAIISGSPSWECQPQHSLCGMTQPLSGKWHWHYHQISSDQRGGGGGGNEGGSRNSGSPFVMPQFSRGNAGMEEESGQRTLRPLGHLRPFPLSKSDQDTFYEQDIFTNPGIGKPLSSLQGVAGLGSQQGFPCPEGRFLQTTWVCDGVSDCDDGSDELSCDCGPDGCNNFEEEFGGYDYETCERNGFSCATGEPCCPSSQARGEACLPGEFVCDGISHCENREDERACQNDQLQGHPLHLEEIWLSDEPKNPSQKRQVPFTRDSGILMNNNLFECSGGLYLPPSLLCDGTKDCPLDGLDEVECHHCGPEDYLCPISGVCLPKDEVCDGIQTCNDEQACTMCPPGHFACDICIPSIKVCDGVWDCLEGEDENRCMNVGPLNDDFMSTDIENPLTQPLSSECHDLFHFTCPTSNHRCLPLSSVCDRHSDCLLGEDERNCPDDNTDEKFYVGAKLSAASGHDSGMKLPSYLITPPLRHERNKSGLLSFRYRLDAWIGSSNVSMSIELLDGNSGRMSIAPWTLWRQSGHKGKLWLNANVIIPELPNVDFFKIGFLLTGSAEAHGSQQVHLAKIFYRNVEQNELKQIGEGLRTCEFKDSWCGWSQPFTEGGYSWVHAEVSPHARRTGPISGFSDESESGFIYTDSLHGREGDSADLLGPPIQFSSAKDEQELCFRFMMFLYGAHVGKLSVHVMQVTSDGRPFTAELFHTQGGQGLSWIPVTVGVSGKDLAEPETPFLLVMRATRGGGPEADIAVDHFSFTASSCSAPPDPSSFKTRALLLHPSFFSPPSSSSLSSIQALKAGLSLTPFIPVDGSPGAGRAVSSDFCAIYTSCRECVLSAAAAECSWCPTSATCFSGIVLPHSVVSCPATQTIFNYQNSKEAVATGAKSGPSWCPRIVASSSGLRQAADNVVSAAPNSLLSLSFAVANIQKRYANLKWRCVLRMEGSLMNEESEGNRTSLRDLKGQKTREEVELKGFSEDEEDEELWRRLKKYALKKKSKKNLIKVPGVFQGSSYGGYGVKASTADSGGKDGVSFGAVKCGDGETLVPSPEAAADEESKIRFHLEIIDPDGNSLDNPEHVHVVVHNCHEIGEDCESCMRLNTSYPCGWCSFTQRCSHHEECAHGLWQSHSNTPNRVCKVQEELLNLKSLLEAEEDDEDFGRLEEELFGGDLEFESRVKGTIANKKKVKKTMKKSFDRENHSGSEAQEKQLNKEESEQKIKTRNRSKKKSKNNKSDDKFGGGKEEEGSVKLGRKGRGKGRGRAFLKIPIQDGVFVARDVWKLHTGRQYYVPVTKKILVNLGFVRHVTYGKLSQVKSRTLLLDGAWKKAAGFFIDLYEKAGRDPMTSIIATNKSTFQKILSQILPE